MQAYIYVEGQSSHCSLSEDSFFKDKIEELDQKVEGILNQTQGTYIMILIIITCTISMQTKLNSL